MPSFERVMLLLFARFLKIRINIFCVVTVPVTSSKDLFDSICHIPPSVYLVGDTTIDSKSNTSDYGSMEVSSPMQHDLASFQISLCVLWLMRMPLK